MSLDHRPDLVADLSQRYEVAEVLTTREPESERYLYFGPTLTRLLKDLDKSSTLQHISDCCSSFCREVGAEYFSYAAFMPASWSSLLVHNLDPEWIDIYKEKQYCKIDPRTRYGLLHNEPVRWSDLSLDNGKKRVLAGKVLDHAREFGYLDGISIPLHGVGSEVALFNLSSSSALPDYNDIEMQSILAYTSKVRHSIRKIQSKLDPASIQIPVLSEREKECLQWTANGKTSWEIGQILGVSESTVVFHISKAVSKLGVSNRVQAVAKAIAQSQILVF